MVYNTLTGENCSGSSAVGFFSCLGGDVWPRELHQLVGIVKEVSSAKTCKLEEAASIFLENLSGSVEEVFSKPSTSNIALL